jgi:acetolactate synthase-1/2/3 large subunit
MVRQWQQLFFERRYSFTELKNPDFTTIARGFSIQGQKVTDRKDLANAVNKMLDHKGAYLLDVIVEKEENVFPMIPSGAAVDDIRME